MTTTLDCGHEPTTDDTAAVRVGTGYAVRLDGTRICYACAEAEEARAFSEATIYTAYVNSAETEFQTWTGGKLARITAKSVSRSGFYGSRVYRYWATAPNGTKWYGANSGAGMVITMRQVKGDA